MHRWPILALTATLIAAAPAQNAQSLRPWRLVWSDEFNLDYAHDQRPECLSTRLMLAVAE